jgi:hypothetical protein
VAVVVDDVVDGIFELVVRPNAQRLGLLAAIGDGPSPRGVRFHVA